MVQQLGKVGDSFDPPYKLELHAFGKPNLTSRQIVANEFVSARLGQFLGLPIPPYAIVRSKGTNPIIYFASMNSNLTGEALPLVVEPEDCVHLFPKESAGAIAFDCWIANQDRHENNISIDTTPPSRMNLFDHEKALFGREGASRLDRLQNDFAIDKETETGASRHCLLDVIKEDHFDFWLERIRAVPSFVIDDSCSAMVDVSVLTEKEAVRLREFLLHRQKNLTRFLSENVREFRSLTNIGLWTQTEKQPID